MSYVRIHAITAMIGEGDDRDTKWQRKSGRDPRRVSSTSLPIFASSSAINHFMSLNRSRQPRCRLLKSSSTYAGNSFENLGRRLEVKGRIYLLITMRRREQSRRHSCCCIHLSSVSPPRSVVLSASRHYQLRISQCRLVRNDEDWMTLRCLIRISARHGTTSTPAQILPPSTRLVFTLEEEGIHT